MQKEEKKFIICEAEVVDNNGRVEDKDGYLSQVYKLKIYLCQDNNGVIDDEMEAERIIEGEVFPENEFKVGDRLVIRINPIQETRSLNVEILGLVDDMPLNYKTAKRYFWGELFK